MSQQYNNENTGILFKNDTGDNPKRPAYKGKIDVGGVEYKLAGWIREGKAGKFISIKIDTDERKPVTKNTDDELDSIPF
jgi:hypothetical protein